MSRRWWQKIFEGRRTGMPQPGGPFARPRLVQLEDRTAPARTIRVEAGVGGDTTIDPVVASFADTTTDYVIDPAAFAAPPGDILLQAHDQIRFVSGVDLTASGKGLTAQSAGVLTLDAGATVNAGAGALVLEGTEIDLGGATITGSGALALRPADPALGLVLGGAANLASRLTLTDADLAAIAPGFAGVTVGRADGTGAFEVVGGAGPDTLRVFRDPGTGDTRARLNALPELTLLTTAFANPGVTSFAFTGGDGADAFIVDYAGGALAPAKVVYDGQGGAGDLLQVLGAAGFSGTYTASGPGAGTVVVQGGGAANTIAFAGLDPVDLVGLDTATVVLLPGIDQVAVENGLTFGPVPPGGTQQPAIVVRDSSGGGGFESVALRGNAVVVIDTNGGGDVVTLAIPTNDHGNQNLTVRDGGGAGAITFTQPATLTGDLSVEAHAIIVPAGQTVAAGKVTFALPAAGTLSLGTVTISGAQGVSQTGAGGTVVLTGVPTLASPAGSVSFAGTIRLNAAAPYTTPGVDFDRMIVNGALDLSGATLSFTGAGGAAAPNQIITVFANDGTDLTVPSVNPSQGSMVTIGGEVFTIFYNGGDGNDVVLVENSTVPAAVYVDDSFTQNPGEPVPDADLGAAGDQPAVFGVTAFRTIAEALAAVAPGGTVLVNSGTYPEAVNLTGGRLLRVTGPDVPGSVTVNSLAGVAGTFIHLSGTSVLTVGGAASTTFAGVIFGPGRLVKQGSGTQTLSGNNVYSGTTTVNAGRLDVNGSVTSNVTVTAPGSLGGTGTVNGNVTSSGTVSPGAGTGIGALTIIGDFTTTGTVQFTVNPPAATPVIDYDRLVVTGLVNLTGATLTFNGAAGPVSPGRVVTLIAHDAGGGSTIASLNPIQGSVVTINGNSYRIFYNGGDGNDVVLVEDSAPTGLVYVDDSFTQNLGQVVPDADLGTAGSQPAVFGVTAFRTIAQALAAVAPGGTVVVNSGAYPEAVNLTGGRILRVTGPNVPGAVTINSLAGVAGTSVVLQGTSVLTVGDGTSTEMAGTLAGTGRLVKQGSGTLTLSGNNTYSGTTTVNAGTLAVTSDTGLGSAAAGTTVAAGATLDVRADIGAEPITVGGGGIGGNGALVTSIGSGTVGGPVTLTANTSIGGGGTLTITSVISDGASSFVLTRVGAGTTTLTAANAYDGGTQINAGTLLANNAAGSGTGTGAVTVSGGTLGGTGTIAGPVTVLAGGRITGGTLGGVGTLTVNSSLTFNGGTYAADLLNDTSDRLVVTGVIDLNGGAAGVLVLNSGTSGGATTPATVFTLIDNTAAGPLVDPPLAGAPEGSTATVNGRSARFTYAGGAGANDFTLVVEGPPSYIMPAAGDYTLRRVVGPGGVDNIEFLQGAVVLDSRPTIAVVGLITVTGTAGADTLTVDYTASGGYFQNDVAFGAGAGIDALNVRGGAFGSIRYDHVGPAAGSIANASPAGALLNTIAFTGAEQVMNTGTASSVVFNLPAGPSAAILRDDAAAGNQFSRLLSGSGSFAQVDFRNPTGALVLNAGNPADTLTVEALPDFNAGLTVGGSGERFGAVTLAVSPTLIAGAGNLSVRAVAINLNSGPITTTNEQVYTGAVRLGANTILTSVAAAPITFAGTIDGGLTLAVNTTGPTTFGGAVGGNEALASLTTNPGGATAVNGGLVRTTGAQSFGDAVTIGVNTLFQTVGGGSITFAGSLAAASPPTATFNVGTSADILFGGPVRQLGGLAVVSARDVTAAAGIEATGDVSIENVRTVTVTGQLAAGRGVGIRATGNVSVTGDIRAGTDVVVHQAQNLTVTGSVVAGSGITLTTSQDIAIDLGMAAGGAVTVTTARNVQITGNVSAPAGSFIQQGGTGTTTLSGGVVTTGAGVSITTGTIALNSGITASGQQVTLQPTAGGVTQSLGAPIVAQDLDLRGGGPFTLNSPGNRVTGAFRAKVNGPVTLRATGDLRLDPTQGAATGGGNLTIYAGGSVRVEDRRAEGTRFSTPLLDAPGGTILIVPGVERASGLTLDAEVRAAAVQFGNPAGSPPDANGFPTANANPDAFRVRPSRLVDITVFGNDPREFPGDSIFPITTDPGIRSIQFVAEGAEGASISGRYEVTFADGTTRVVRFREIESFGEFGYRAAVVQTGARDYSVRLQLVQDRPLGGSVQGQAIEANPFVVSPVIINPTTPFGAPTLAFGDVNGDGAVDLVIANGPDDAPLVTVINGLRLFQLGIDGQNAQNLGPIDLSRLNPDRDLLAQFFAFDPNFRGGMSVATADVNGDKRAEVIIGAGPGGGPRVLMFTFRDAGSVFDRMERVFSQYVFEDSFRGGVNVAMGDIDADGVPDLVAGAGAGGAPRVVVFSGRPLAGGALEAIQSFYAYTDSLRGGVLVAAGDLDGDGRAEILTGPGYGGDPHLLVFGFDAGGPTILFSFYALQPESADALRALTTGGKTGVGGVAFGAPVSATGGREILVSTARGVRLQMERYVLDPGTGALQKAGDLYTELTTRPGGIPIVDDQTNPPRTIDDSELFDGGSVAGFAAASGDPTR